MHKLLEYQIRKFLEGPQPLLPGFDDFLKAVGQAYRDFDEDFQRIEQAYEKVAHELETQSREKDLLLQSAGSGIIRVNTSGHITFFNPAALRMLGYTAQELLGRSFHKSILHSHPDESPYWEEISPLNRALTNKACYRQSNEVFWRKNRDCFPVDYTCTPVLDQDMVRGAVIVFKNISRQIQTQQALETYTQELEEHKGNLEDFNSIASHDLREPLRKIKTFAGILRERIGSQLEGPEQEYLSRLIQASDRMDDLIIHLLEYSQAGIKSLKPEQIDLKYLVQETIFFLEVLVRQTGGKITVTAFPPNLHPFIFADRNQMYQLFQNLISNSLKYCRPDVPPKIEIRINPLDRETMKIQVQDNGIGFEESHVKKIFKPFERLHGKSEYEGVGMGLAICQKIVSRHGGTISVLSQPDRGSTFILTLPRNQALPETGEYSVPARRKQHQDPVTNTDNQA